MALDVNHALGVLADRVRALEGYRQEDRDLLSRVIAEQREVQALTKEVRQLRRQLKAYFLHGSSIGDTIPENGK